MLEHKCSDVGKLKVVLSIIWILWWFFEPPRISFLFRDYFWRNHCIDLQLLNQRTLIKTFELTDQQMDITLSKVSKVACRYVVTPQLTKQRFSMVHLVQVTNFALIVDNCDNEEVFSLWIA